MQTLHSTPPILLIGHRGSGKTTLGALLAREISAQAPQEPWEFVDLDAEIERVSGQTPAAIIAEDEANFRRMESAQLRRVLNESRGRRVIALGAGCQMPRADVGAVAPLFVWLWRDGWVEEARVARARLRQAMSFEEEVGWMRQTREPAWAKVAHLFFEIPRGRSPELAARMLADYTRWALDARRSAVAGRSWLVPNSAAAAQRAARDARLFGLAGVEIRSDLFAERSVDKTLGDTPVLASLRSDAPQWLEALGAQATAHALDIDVGFLEPVRRAKTLERLAPRPLLLSTHPGGTGQQAADALLGEAAKIAAELPQWAAHIQFKYAPRPESFDALRVCFAIAETLRKSGYRTTFLPQGARFAWTRPILANPNNGIGLVNAYNYVPVGVRQTRLQRQQTPPGTMPSPMDVQDWLPHFAQLSAPRTPDYREHFDALIGDPVSASVGDWWHTRAAIAEGKATRYLKISLGRDDDAGALEQAFKLFEALGLRGLSVTSPLKRRMGRMLKDGAEANAGAPLNTLRRDADGWAGRDTDELGMLATLRAIMEDARFAERPAGSARTVSIIGRGGVSPAILRAVEAAGWTLVEHASARAGWKLSRTQADAKDVDLVINAAGARPGIERGAPTCEVWLDLHYNSVAPKPEGARAHLNGDIFFDAQARAQRVFWEMRDV